MRELIDKLKQVEQKLSQEHGSFDLFAVLERDDVPDRYDLIVAAPWLPNNLAEAISLIAVGLKDANLSTDEMRLLARIVPLNTDDEVLHQIMQAFKLSGHETIDRNHFGNVDVRRGIAIHH